MRTTVLDAKNSRIPNALGICDTDSRFLQWLNEATQRLMVEGRWWGTTARFKICASNGCLTMPPQIATIEAVNVCGHPTPIRDMWWEFLENGPGSGNPQTCNSSNTTPGSCAGGCMNNAVYRGNFPSFDDIHGPGKKLNLVCDLVSDVNKEVICMGYDDNGNWIRTNQGGTILDGEIVLLTQGAGTNSLNNFSSITDMQFVDDRDGQVWLYEFDVASSTKRMVGHYEYFEKRPSYPRYKFPGIIPQASGSGGCSAFQVEIIGKLEYIPVAKDTDYLIIGNIPAMKEMMKALRDSENEPDGIKSNAIMVAGLKTATSILDSELDHYYGAGRRIGINIMGSSIGTLDPIPNFI